MADRQRETQTGRQTGTCKWTLGGEGGCTLWRSQQDHNEVKMEKKKKKRGKQGGDHSFTLCAHVLVRQAKKTKKRGSGQARSGWTCSSESSQSKADWAMMMMTMPMRE